MNHSFFTSESVSMGHPDKVADQISDAILDECLRGDPESKVACEVMVSSGLVFICGEITTETYVDCSSVAQDVIKRIGYDDPMIGFDYSSCAVIVNIKKQSKDIAQGVLEGKGLHKEQGAGDQGLMFGYACRETEELMPLPIMLAHKIIRALEEARQNNLIEYLKPDAKAQITVEYDEKDKPIRVDTVVISTQHRADITHEQIEYDMKQLASKVIGEAMLDEKTIFHINPTGRFVEGGPKADTGLTGRKIIVDTYGGIARHGGGAFSGKDPSKVDRSAAYAARYIAKNIVMSGLADTCEIQLAYAIGVAEPISIKINTFGTSETPEEILSDSIREIFSLTPHGIINMLDLKRPIYEMSAHGGHFGRCEEEFSWEKTDKTDAIKSVVLKKLEAIS